jgi:hypothetical protein
LNVDHAQLRKIINTGTKICHRKSNLRNKGQYHLSSEKHVIMIITTNSFDTSQAGVSDSLPESLPSPLDSQKPNASTHVGPPYPDIGTLYRGLVV